MKYIPKSEFEVYTETNGWLAVNRSDFSSDDAVQRYLDKFKKGHVKLKGCPPPLSENPITNRSHG